MRIASRSLVGLRVSGAALFVACAVSAQAAEPSWQTLMVDLADDTATAVALRGDGHFAVGDARGVVRGAVGGELRRVVLRGVVRDLAFAADFAETGSEPALLAATTLGLYRVTSDDRVESLAPGPGPAAQAVARIATRLGVVAVASADGVFFSSDLRSWHRLPGPHPSGAASAVALRERGNVVECWAAIRGELWRSEMRRVGGEWVAATSVRVPIPFRGVPVDLVLDLGGADVVVVFPSALVVRREPDHVRRDPTDREVTDWRVTDWEVTDWEVLRPTFPPGAVAARLVAALDWLWLATDRGVLRAPDLRGPWRRASGQPGSRAALDLATGQGALYAATRAGVAVARALPARSPAGRAAPEGPDPREPGIEAVHRAALAYLRLQPAALEALRRGVTRRGWLPTVGFRVTHDSGSSRANEYDEAFIGGGMRQLHDRDRDRSRDLELQLSLSWDLGDVAYHPEQIDVSREAREIIELRDDVLDEITQLYFDRRRVLTEAAAAPADLALRRRADQLAAGIDAWTGGWFSRQLTPPTP